jgi:hypothetical protein
MSEFLRIEQRDGQIAQKQNRKNECNCRNQIHGLPQLLACLDVEKGNAEENHREEKHRYILHRGITLPLQSLGQSCSRAKRGKARYRPGLCTEDEFGC